MKELLHLPADIVLQSGKVREVRTRLQLSLPGGPEWVELAKYVAVNDPAQEKFRTPQGAFRKYVLIWAEQQNQPNDNI